LGALTYDLEPLSPRAGQFKSGGGSFSPDKHKAKLLKRRLFAFLAALTYDLEGLAAGAGQFKSGGGSLSPKNTLKKAGTFHKVPAFFNPTNFSLYI
jgi:hypothetical protein